MNTLHFKYAVEVERTGSITQAADNLYMAQPNLSKAIKELEDTLGITVFKRTSRGMVPTKKGAAFLIYAKKILAQLDEVESLCRADNGGRQRFNISIPRVSYIAKAVTRFVEALDGEPGDRRKHPGNELNKRDPQHIRGQVQPWHNPLQDGL